MSMQEKLEMMERVQRETEGKREEERPGSESSGKSRVCAGVRGVETSKRNKFKREVIQDKEYLKLYRSKNDTHSGDREKASSILQNMNVPSSFQFLKGNPIFDKNCDFDVEIELKPLDLYAMGQIN